MSRRRSAFQDFFGEVQLFSDNNLVLSREAFTLEQAAAMFREFIVGWEGVDVPIDLADIEEERVRYQFCPPYEVDSEPGESRWFTGASRARGSKPIWMYDMNISLKKRE